MIKKWSRCPVSFKGRFFNSISIKKKITIQSNAILSKHTKVLGKMCSKQDTFFGQEILQNVACVRIQWVNQLITLSLWLICESFVYILFYLLLMSCGWLLKALSSLEKGSVLHLEVPGPGPLRNPGCILPWVYRDEDHCASLPLGFMLGEPAGERQLF